MNLPSNIVDYNPLDFSIEDLEEAMSQLNKVKPRGITIYTGEFGARSIDALIRGDEKEMKRLSVISHKKNTKYRVRELMHIHTAPNDRSLLIYLDTVYHRNHSYGAKDLSWEAEEGITIAYNHKTMDFTLTQWEPEYGYDCHQIKTKDPLMELKNWKTPWTNEDNS